MPVLARLLRDVEIDADLPLNVIASQVCRKNIDYVPLIVATAGCLDLRFVDGLPGTASHLFVDKEEIHAACAREASSHLHDDLLLGASLALLASDLDVTALSGSACLVF